MSATMSKMGQEMPKSVVAVYSGGMDSTAMLFQMREQGIDVRGALTVDYGQKHKKEIDQARMFCAELGIEHRVADLSDVVALFGKSSLTDANTSVPEGHYEEESMKQTVVPNRNMILISLATAWAITLQADAVAYAAHSGDHAIYPDCRESFAKALDKAIMLCDWSEVHLYRPFVNLRKDDIARIGADCGVPFEDTWSCYNGRELHCGRCGTCIERREALYLAGVEDPTIYEKDAPTVEDLVDCNWKLNTITS